MEKAKMVKTSRKRQYPTKLLIVVHTSDSESSRAACAHAGTLEAALRGAGARVATVYGKVRRGAYRIDCAIGAAPSSIADGPHRRASHCRPRS